MTPFQQQQDVELLNALAKAERRMQQILLDDKELHAALDTATMAYLSKWKGKEVTFDDLAEWDEDSWEYEKYYLARTELIIKVLARTIDGTWSP